MILKNHFETAPNFYYPFPNAALFSQAAITASIIAARTERCSKVRTP